MKQLSFFIETANSGSIKKASDILHITPSGLRLALHRLEDELDAKLVVWGSNSFTLTKDGEMVLHYARDIMRSYNECISKLGSEQHSTVVKVASGVNFPVNFIGSSMLDFQSEYPCYRSVLTDYSGTQCDEAVLSGEAELGFNIGPFDEGNFLYYPITEFSLHVLLNSSEDDAKLSAFPIERLEEYSLILTEIKPTDDSFSNLCSSFGISPYVVSRVQRDLAMTSVLSTNKGYLGITHREAFEAINSSKVALVPFENDLFTKTVYLFHRKGAHLSDAAQAFKKFYLDKVKDGTFKVS